MKIRENDLNSNPNQKRSKDVILQDVKTVRKGGFTIIKRSTIVQVKDITDFTNTVTKEIEAYKANSKSAKRQTVNKMLDAFA